MKTCSYCGQENPESGICCQECGSELAPPKKDSPVNPPSEAERPATPLIDLGTIENAFGFEEGFSRPNWPVIYKKIEDTIRPEDLQQAWVEVGLQWMTLLRDELGGDYRVAESADFFLLSALDQGELKRVLDVAEAALQAIRGQFQHVAWKGFFGKHVILLFIDEDDYYQYQAAFVPDGVNVRTGGVMLGGGYVHIALPYRDALTVRPVLAHELAHTCVAHLPLPLWLNEGVAVRVEHLMTRPNEPVLQQELADQLRNFWTEANIQKFWAGTSFYEPGDAQTLSYDLAEILVHMLVGDHQVFLSFMSQAHYVDGGQTAALDCLGTSLGDVAASFLGPGDWRPYRKALADCWANSSRREKPSVSVPDGE